jgi:hypothetical protein
VLIIVGGVTLPYRSVDGRPPIVLLSRVF